MSIVKGNNSTAAALAQQQITDMSESSKPGAGISKLSTEKLCNNGISPPQYPVVLFYCSAVVEHRCAVNEQYILPVEVHKSAQKLRREIADIHQRYL